MHILTLTSLFPNAMQPVHAVFIRNRMQNFARRHGHKWTVVAPVAWWPKLPFSTVASYDRLARVPLLEDLAGHAVHHPRYLVTPKVGMSWYGRWMSIGVRRTVEEIHRREPIDVIDGHYIYPDGTAAVDLGRDLGIPVVLSARGTDLNLYPSIPAIRPILERNLERTDHLICVCSDLKDVALELGMPANRISVVGNGVDTAVFSPGSQAEARRTLGLPMDRRIFVAVGHLTERKGFHLAIEALASLANKDALLAVVGAGPEGAALAALAERLGVKDRVIMPGAVLNRDLPAWYRAGDVFVLASSREGWPNVVCEAQATGLPVVATAVWGIPEIVSEPYLGTLVKERTSPALAAAMASSLAASWDRPRIAELGQSRSWENVSDRLQPIFASVAGARR